jgi:hypothetical protein
MQHSNFANIGRSIEALEKLGFVVELKEYEFPVGRISGSRLSYFINNLPPNCHPIRKHGEWYQRIGVFRCYYNDQNRRN